NCSELLSGLFSEAVNEVLDKQGDVRCAIAQRRHLNRHDIQSVEEILAKLAFGHKRVQVTMRGRQHSYVKRNWPVTADTFDLTFLQHSQQRDWDFRGQIAYFVQEDRSAVRRFKTSQAPLRCSSECALFVTKQFGSDQRWGDCRTIHTNKCPLRAVGSPVDGARNQLLSRAGFAQNQNGGIRMCHLVDLAEHLTQRFRGADYVLEHRVTIDLLSQRDGFVSQAVFGAFTVVDV